MRLPAVWLEVLVLVGMGLTAGTAWGLTVLLAPGLLPEADVAPRLTALVLGLIAAEEFDYQSADDFNVIDTGHPLTHHLETTSYALGYANMTWVKAPGADTTTLAIGAADAAVVVHNVRRVAAPPYYGAYWHNDLWSNVGFGITDNCVRWAAAEAVSRRRLTWGAVKSLFVV